MLGDTIAYLDLLAIWVGSVLNDNLDSIALVTLLNAGSIAGDVLVELVGPVHGFAASRLASGRCRNRSHGGRYYM